MKLDHIEAGHRFEPYSFVIDEDSARAYIFSTGESSETSAFEGSVHPLQIDAAVLSRLIDELGIIEDRIETIHAGQQMTVHCSVTPGDAVTAQTTLKTNAVRRGSRWANFETKYTTGDGEAVAESASTIILMQE